MGDRPGADALAPLPARSPKVAARVINGEAMILTPHDSVLHTLNPVATRIWELLPTHPTLAAVVETLTSEYDAAPDEIERDVAELVAALVERQILQG
ncbi:MAG: hypothetical protein JWM80_428 [Cyanobacteria bacterium RYN_339]|nr:hypothetical protein [Cyanobacteria bacterium RYN_339]